MIENKKSNKDSGKIMIKVLKLSKIKAFMLFLKVHQKFRPYSIICAMHIRASEDASVSYTHLQTCRMLALTLMFRLKSTNNLGNKSIRSFVYKQLIDIKGIRKENNEEQM